MLCHVVFAQVFMFSPTIMFKIFVTALLACDHTFLLIFATHAFYAYKNSET